MNINRGEIKKLPKPSFISWIAAQASIKINDKHVDCYQINWKLDETALDDWALHIRRHYIRDDELQDICAYRNENPSDYLKRKVIPQRSDRGGPSMITGDFVEILIIDLLQFVMNYITPRYKHHGRKDKLKSDPGSDIIAYRFERNQSSPTSNDTLQIIEAKSAISKKNERAVKSVFSDAINSSNKDRNRVAMTLDYMRDCAFFEGDLQTANEIGRFQDKAALNFTERFGIAVAIDSSVKIGTDINLPIDKTDSLNGLLLLASAQQFQELVYEVFSRCIA